jgi:hypothetical protein
VGAVTEVHVSIIAGANGAREKLEFGVTGQRQGEIV